MEHTKHIVGIDLHSNNEKDFEGVYDPRASVCRFLYGHHEHPG